MIKVLLADDHDILRFALREIIAQENDMSVTEEACNGYEVMEKVRNREFDVVLLDISMPKLGGMEVLPMICSEKPGLPVIILSMYPEETYGLRMIKSGAMGYLSKERCIDEITIAIRRVYTHRRYFSNTLSEMLQNSFGNFENKNLPHENLSMREFQVLKYFGEGKTVKEISVVINLSVNTISTYRSRVLKKMEMQTNAQLIAYAIKNNLVVAS